MNICIKKLSPEARVPTYAHAHDAGIDIYATESITLGAGERHAVKTGIAMAIPDGHVGLVWDKSGRALHDGLTTMAGVVDASYRGEVQVVLLNCSDKPVMISSGEKIAQLLIQPVIHAVVEEVDELSDTVRGEGGFGSTGL